MSTLTHTTGKPSTGRRRGFHSVNIGHLVMGIAFLGIFVAWILVASDAVTGADVRWLLPVPWVLAGIVGLVATATRGTRSDTREEWMPQQGPGWVGVDPDAPVPPRSYDDLDDKLAQAEADRKERLARESVSPTVQPSATTTEPGDPTDHVDPTDPTDPTDPADPADPQDPSTQEDPR